MGPTLFLMLRYIWSHTARLENATRVNVPLERPAHTASARPKQRSLVARRSKAGVLKARGRSQRGPTREVRCAGFVASRGDTAVCKEAVEEVRVQTHIFPDVYVLMPAKKRCGAGKTKNHWGTTGKNGTEGRCLKACGPYKKRSPATNRCRLKAGVKGLNQKHKT